MAYNFKICFQTFGGLLVWTLNIATQDNIPAINFIHQVALPTN